MPGGDGTGPFGNSNWTCMRVNGRGAGFRRGLGRGFCRRFGFGYGQGMAYAKPIMPSKDEQKEALEAELKEIEAEKQVIETRLKELE